jgi:multiple sugar transport system permease protein
MSQPLIGSSELAGGATVVARHGSAPTRNRLAFVTSTAPALGWFVFFMLVPLVAMFVLSVFRWNDLLALPRFSALDNYARMLADLRFAQAVRNTVVQVVVGMVTVIPIAFLLGYFLSLRPPGHRLLAIIFFTPAISSVTAKAVIFTGLFQPFGVVNLVLNALGLGALSHVWLGDPSSALGVIISVDIWGGIGFYAVLFSAALSNVPQELYEAAQLEGAGHLALVRRIALPLTMDFVGVAMTLHLLYLLVGSAQNVLLITQGGPGDYSLTLPYYMYERAFPAHQLGYSQAIAVVLFAAGLAGLLVIRRATRRHYEL